MRGSYIFAAFVAFISVVTAAPYELHRRAPLETVTAPNVPTSGNVVLQSFSYDSESGLFSGNIWIRNLAFAKTVEVFYSTPTGQWVLTNKVNAAYSAPAANNFEVWSFNAPSPANLGAGSQFYLKYVVAGQTFFDNNATRNYLVRAAPTTPTSTAAPPTSPPTAPPTSSTATPTSTTAPPAPSVTFVSNVPGSNGPNVQVQQYSFSGGVLAGGIFVKNIAFSKVVTVIASSTLGIFDNAATTAATYSGPAANGYELWVFSAALPGVGSGSQFYVKFDANGQSFFDSNGGIGRNYPITGVPSPAGPSGLAEDVTSWFSTAVPLLKRYLFNNISPAGTVTGVVVAAPKLQETTKQDYFFHWIRDASLVMDLVNNLYKDDSSLESRLWDYASVTKIIQGKTNSAGSLGEPKYFVNTEPFNGPWCRPQNDGPALRASVFIRFAKVFLAKGGSLSRVAALYNSTSTGVIKTDLDYAVSKLSVSDGCDLWEEQRGLHLFTQQMERKALKEGAEFARFLGDTAAANRYAGAASVRDSEMGRYWDPSVRTLRTTLGARQLDAAIALTAIHGYNNDGVYGPDDDRVLNSLFQFSLGFIPEYALNRRGFVDSAGRPISIALGRYYGDTYNGIDNSLGNPWYLTTNAVGETYYRAAVEYLKAGRVTVTPLNRPLFTADRPAGAQAGNIALGTYAKGTPEFNAIIGGLANLADTHIRRTRFHGDVNFRFGEQYLRSDGSPNGLGVRDLTWSYSSFLTAYEAREELKALLSA
ncbi:Six-hairpin glycosidase-like protein [Chytridium lagenaria]|nr:Six-hairpin glycosidase-like protein [Chytridium lagenaria]